MKIFHWNIGNWNKIALLYAVFSFWNDDQYRNFVCISYPITKQFTNQPSILHTMRRVPMNFAKIIEIDEYLKNEGEGDGHI